MIIKKAIFPVGGLGTHVFASHTAMPKEMLPVVDKPLIQYAVEEAAKAGVEGFIFVTGRNKSAIEDHFDHSTELENVLQAKGKSDALATVHQMMHSLVQCLMYVNKACRSCCLVRAIRSAMSQLRFTRR